MPKVFVIRLGAIIGLLFFTLGLIGFNHYFLNQKANYLTVTFLNIGQGDAILIETVDGVVALIDGGPDSTIMKALNQELSFFNRKIDFVVGTHPDKDHIGGLIDVLNRYQVDYILTTENRGETIVSSTYQEALLREDAEITYARSGQIFNLGAFTTLKIYSPERDPSLLESNTSSIVVKLSYGTVDFMLTGDAPVGIEDYLVVKYGQELESEVLKLGHHGSKTSTSDLFLETVKPTYAVVSSGKNNSYGHPHSEVVNRVEEFGAKLKSTATEGNITFFTDGVKIWSD